MTQVLSIPARILLDQARALRRKLDDLIEQSEGERRHELRDLAHLARTQSKRDVKKKYKGKEETLQRLVSFYGPDLIYGRKSLFYLRFGRGTGSAWPRQELNEDEVRRLKKATRRRKKRW